MQPPPPAWSATSFNNRHVLGAVPEAATPSYRPAQVPSLPGRRCYDVPPRRTPTPQQGVFRIWPQQAPPVSFSITPPRLPVSWAAATRHSPLPGHALLRVCTRHGDRASGPPGSAPPLPRHRSVRRTQTRAEAPCQKASSTSPARFFHRAPLRISETLSTSHPRLSPQPACPGRQKARPSSPTLRRPTGRSNSTADDRTGQRGSRKC